jgi:hypothetical protein
MVYEFFLNLPSEIRCCNWLRRTCTEVTQRAEQPVQSRTIKDRWTPVSSPKRLVCVHGLFADVADIKMSTS